MAVALTPEQRQALRGPLAIRVLIDLYLDSGRFSFWDGEGHVNFDGTRYLAAGAFLSAGSVTMGADLGVENVTLTLDGTRLVAAAAEEADPGALLATFGQENYQQRRIEIRFAIFDALTGELVLLLRRFAGLIQQAILSEAISEAGAAVALRVVCESVARRYGRRGGRTRSHEDQTAIFAGDDFFKFVASTVLKERTIYWGRLPPKTANAPRIGASRGRNPIRPVNE
jgi:hypothetical protein